LKLKEYRRIKMDFTTDWEKMRDFFKLTQEEFLESYEYVSEEEYIATARIVAKADNPNFDIELKFIKHVDSLEGRDLMYFLIQDCMGLNPEQNSEYYYVLQNIEGDAITSFLADNLSDRLVKNFIKEEIND
tara:strand:- start:61 stop:453 length:393 start_codon:yes stop_codon:yes gene_type:complete